MSNIKLYRVLLSRGVSKEKIRIGDLSFSNLEGANLEGSNLEGANLIGASLYNANLESASLYNANLENLKTNNNTLFFSLQCPEEGSFIAYKKATNNSIVKLQFTEDSLRSSATSRKCRGSKCKVLSIEDKNGISIEKTQSSYDKNFWYIVGETIEIDNFDTNRWNECSNGVHFFITKQEAINY